MKKPYDYNRPRRNHRDLVRRERLRLILVSLIGLTIALLLVYFSVNK